MAVYLNLEVLMMLIHTRGCNLKRGVEIGNLLFYEMDTFVPLGMNVDCDINCGAKKTNRSSTNRL